MYTNELAEYLAHTDSHQAPIQPGILLAQRNTDKAAGPERWRRGESLILISAILAVLCLILLGLYSYASTRRLITDAVAVKHAHEIQTKLVSLLSSITDAESGMRGYVITGDEAFLAPHWQGRARVESIMDTLRHEAKNAGVRQRLASLAPLLERRLALMANNEELRRTRGFGAARDRVASGEGRVLQARIRSQVSALMELEAQVIARREGRAARTARSTFAMAGIFCGLSVLLLAGGATLTALEQRRRRRAELALEASHALHQAVLDGAEHTIIAGDERNVTLFNRAAERLLGYTAEEVVGRVTAAIFHDPAEVARRAEALSVELGERVEPGMETFLAKSRRGLRDLSEWTYLAKDGRRIPVLLEITALRNALGEITSFLGIAQDFTERKQAEEILRQTNAELARAKERAESADRIKSAFLANMSHELRTPLNSIIGFTGILLQRMAGPLNEEQQRQLEMVRGSARHLLALINDVLDISKIEAGELRVQAEPFALRPSVDRLLGSVALQAAEKGLDLRLDWDATLGELTQDQRRVEQVLLNLLNNAIKFTPSGGIRLSARGRGAWVDLAVHDMGIGITPEDMSRLFLPFQQVDSGLARNYDGTGLGLAICRRLALLMGGDVRAESVPGQGSVFTLSLPQVMGSFT